MRGPRAPTSPCRLGVVHWSTAYWTCVQPLAAQQTPLFNNLGFRVGFQQVPDTVSPELELFGGTDVPHELGEPWAEPGYAASDERDGNLTSSVTISGTPNINTSGTYTITYTVADAAGNEANATRTVRVMPFISYDPSALDANLTNLSNSGVTDVFVQGPVGQV